MKAILFDACDVLYHRPRYERELDRYFGPERSVISSEKSQKFKDLHAKAAAGDLSVEDMLNGMLDLYGVAPEGVAQGRRFLIGAMADIDYFDGVRETLHRLRAAGFKLGVVTNSFQRSETKLAWFAKAGIDKVWDVFVSSSETGLLKPGPEIFLKALDKLDCLPGEAAYVAHAADELAGAKAVGMMTIAFNRDNASIQADRVIEHFSELMALTTEIGR